MNTSVSDPFSHHILFALLELKVFSEIVHCMNNFPINVRRLDGRSTWICTSSPAGLITSRSNYKYTHASTHSWMACDRAGSVMIKTRNSCSHTEIRNRSATGIFLGLLHSFIASVSTNRSTDEETVRFTIVGTQPFNIGAENWILLNNS